MFVRPIARKFALVGATCAVVGAYAINAAPVANAAGSGSISGYVWNDANRNGVHDSGESAFSGKLMKLYNSSGTNVASVSTASDGSFSFTNLASGSWQIAMGSSDVQSMNHDWVPTTTGGSLFFQRTVSVGSTAANGDLGLRQIVRSSTDGQPITSATGSDGLKVESYNDAVTAQTILSTLQQGALRGGEAATTRFRFDLAGNPNYCSWNYLGSEGAYHDFSAIVDVQYDSWIADGTRAVFHEYGHSWTVYTDTILNGTDTWDAYLKFRGLYGDSRIGSSHSWQPQEMIAEDYRQLFGTNEALTVPQENTDIPSAANVAGLKDWFVNTFGAGKAGTGSTGSTGSGSTGGTTTTTTTAPDVAVSSLAMNPTPVATSGTASFSINVDATVTVKVLDSTGALVKTLASNVAKTAGSQSFIWDRTNAQGRKVRGGTYRLSVSATANSKTSTATLDFTVSK